MCGYRKICVTYVDPWFPYEEEWLVYHVSWDCTRNPQRPEAISMNVFDKVHEYGEGGAGPERSPGTRSLPTSTSVSRLPRSGTKCMLTLVQYMLHPTEQENYGSLPSVYITSASICCRNGSVCRDVIDNRFRMRLVTTDPSSCFRPRTVFSIDGP